MHRLVLASPTQSPSQREVVVKGAEEISRRQAMAILSSGMMMGLSTQPAQALDKKELARRRKKVDESEFKEGELTHRTIS